MGEGGVVCQCQFGGEYLAPPAEKAVGSKAANNELALRFKRFHMNTTRFIAKRKLFGFDFKGKRV